MEVVKRQIAEEQRQRLAQREVLKRDATETLQAKDRVRQAEQHRTDRDRVQHIANVEGYARHEADSQELYKRYFDHADKEMEGRQKLHVEKVLRTEGAKNEELAEWIRRNEELLKQRQREREQRVKEWRRQVDGL